MSRVAVNSLMVWLLTGPPALCRAGVLVECCDHESSPSAALVEILASTCCAHEEPRDSAANPPPEPSSRTCGDCVGVCDSVAKPPEDFHNAALAAVVIATIPAALEAPTPLRTGTDRLCTQFRGGRPYPPSDVPLLI